MVNFKDPPIEITSVKIAYALSVYFWLQKYFAIRKISKIRQSTIIKKLLKDYPCSFTKDKIIQYTEILFQEGLIDVEAIKADLEISLVNNPQRK